MTALQTTFLFLAAGMILFWILFAVNPVRTLEAARVIGILRYGALLRLLALFLALAPPVVMVGVIGGFAWKSNATLAIAGSSFLAISLLAGLLLLETESVQVLLSEDGITCFSPWNGLATLKWSEIEQVRYSAVNRWFVLRGARRTIRVSRHLDGIALFSVTLRRKVAADRFAGAAEVLEKIT